MEKLLIAVHSDYFADMLKSVFSREFDIEVCTDGCDCLQLLSSFAPDAMILCLSLPRMDGLTILEQSSHIPRIILGIVNSSNPFVSVRAAQLGVGRILTMPTVNSVAVALLQMRMDLRGQVPPDPRDQASLLLYSLGVPVHLEGYTILRLAIPLFAADPTQRLSKDLYPATAKQLGDMDIRSIEHAIRTCIKAAWKRSNIFSWQKFFPLDSNGDLPCPNNLKFIKTLAEHIRF